MGGGKMGGGKMGGMATNSKRQLATLVVKLDQLTEKPLAISLSNDQKKKVLEQLTGLEGLKELPEEDAKKRLEAILDVVKTQKDVLEAAGYRWPGPSMPAHPCQTCRTLSKIRRTVFP